MKILKFIALLSMPALAAPFTVKEGLFDSTKTDLGLSFANGTETFTVFTPTASSDHYGNGVVLTQFKNKLYCQWQSSKTDEDSKDTWVAYSIGTEEGETINWSEPMELAPTISDGYRTSGGWMVHNDTLIAFINQWPDSLTSGGFAYYRESADGINWGDIKPVKMKDGKVMEGVIEQDGHVYNSRLFNAAHFQPGLLANPIYSDDLSGRTGWVKASYRNLDHSGTSSREMEPSLFQNSHGQLVMTFRDQNSSYRRLASISNDNGASWSDAELTNMPDSRAKQSAGNLPDGSAYLVGNPVTNNIRIPLAITLSDDGNVFDRAFKLRTLDEIPQIVYEGKAKRQGYHYPKSVRIDDYLYVAYATNKELIEVTRVPLAEISDYTPEEKVDSIDVEIPKDSSGNAADSLITRLNKKPYSHDVRRNNLYFDTKGRTLKKARKDYIYFSPKL